MDGRPPPQSTLDLQNSIFTFDSYRFALAWRFPAFGSFGQRRMVFEQIARRHGPNKSRRGDQVKNGPQRAYEDQGYECQQKRSFRMRDRVTVDRVSQVVNLQLQVTSNI